LAQLLHSGQSALTQPQTVLVPYLRNGNSSYFLSSTISTHISNLWNILSPSWYQTLPFTIKKSNSTLV